MTGIDWAVVWVFLAISVGLGAMMRRAGSRDLEAYFASSRTLGWWLAGTSIAATAFSSDTPLLVTGMVRRKGTPLPEGGLRQRANMRCSAGDAGRNAEDGGVEEGHCGAKLRDCLQNRVWRRRAASA